MMKVMIYLLASSAVDATRFAAQALGIPIGEQYAKVRYLDWDAANRPFYFGRDDVVTETPDFQAERLAGKHKLLVAALRLMNRPIAPPYDLPRDTSLEAIEEWLES